MSTARTEPLQLAALVRDLEIDYTALSLAAPDQVRFRYTLEGHDDGWQDAGKRRQAFYSALRPGAYRFHVIASNNDGVWNDEGAIIAFHVAPAWFQNQMFQGLVITGAAGLLWLFYRLRVRQIASAMTARYDERLAERTRVAREIHDTFLQTVQGSKMVAEHALRDPGDHSRMVRAMEQIFGWLGQATEEGRAALNSLRASTSETNDLAAALRRAIDDCRQGSDIDTSLTLTGDSREMHPIVRDEVYRIGYEAIRNACAHSSARRVEVALDYGRHLSVRVSDNGIGMDTSLAEHGREGHFGLRGMHERAGRIGGRFTVASAPGSGTVITLIVPGGSAFTEAARARS
jgi:signal transduction histidine kinase